MIEFSRKQLTLVLNSQLLHLKEKPGTCLLTEGTGDEDGGLPSTGDFTHFMCGRILQSEHMKAR